MSLRPGTKYLGSSLNDTGAHWIEFVSATDDVALPEITDGVMRVWLGTDAHALALLERPNIATTVDLSDTGWEDNSSGGSASVSSTDAIPMMTSATTNGVTISASSENISAGYDSWKVGDNDNSTFWLDTGPVGTGGSILPSQIQFDFGSGNTVAVRNYSIRSGHQSTWLDNAPTAWTLQGSSDAMSWTTEDSRSSETGWSVSEKRSYTAQNDTGSTAYRYWRVNVSAVDGDDEVAISEIELFPVAGSAASAVFTSGTLTLNATAEGTIASVRKRVIVDTGDVDVEHSLAINVGRGPVTLRVGSTSGDDDYINETSIGTGYHNLAFTPSGNFHITLRSTSIVDRIISSLTIGDTGTVAVTAPWTANDIDNIRYDQSADVVYVDCSGIKPHKIERRGTGRSWSVVEYAPDNGPFLATRSTSAQLSVSHFYGNTTMESDVPFFTAGHTGALFSLTHDGQSGEWALGALNAKTDTFKVTGISDTGTTPPSDSERAITFSVTGTWAGTITIERSFDDEDFGFKAISTTLGQGSATDTGTFSKTIIDKDDNVEVYYRAKITAYTSGVAIVNVTYGNGQTTGVVRVTAYNGTQSVDVEVLERPSDTGYTEDWQEGYWSDANGYPTAVALHGGRLAHSNGANLFMSVSDDYENFSQSVIGDAGPIIRTLGSGPVDNIFYLVSLLRLIVGTAGAEIAIRSSSLDEPLTPDNSSARTFSTQGSANLRAVKLDTRAIMVQRSKQRLFMIGFGVQGDALGDYEGYELTLLVPDLLAAGVVSIAIQRQPDTRIHCVLADGKVAILTYEPQEEVICWTMWETNGTVERAMVLPGVTEDAVYYHINRTINGTTKRFLEKWAKESECLGDTGLSWLADCAVSFSDTGRATSFADAAVHLPNTSVIAWGDLDTGTTPYVDLSPDVAGVQTTYTVDTGGDLDISGLGLTNGVHQGVVGLGYTAHWKSTKLAYAAQFGTALSQFKRVDKIGLLLYQAHPNALFFGSDTGHLDPIQRVQQGAVIDEDVIFETLDAFPTPFNGTWSEDSRIALKAIAPRPVTILACVPVIETNEKN